MQTIEEPESYIVQKKPSYGKHVVAQFYPWFKFHLFFVLFCFVLFCFKLIIIHNQSWYAARLSHVNLVCDLARHEFPVVQE